MAAERIIGVDFGTSTSVIRVKRYENGKPLGEMLETKEVIFGGMGATVPTLIQKKDEDASVVYYGYEAQQKRKKASTYHSFKVDLESADSEKRAQARRLTEEFYAYLAKQYKTQSDGGHLGNPDDKERAIISYPVKWSEETKQFMLEAAKKAGFPNVIGMDEAQAAIHAVTVQSADYLRKNGLLTVGVPVNILLIDMGAGTTDLVLCRHTPGAAAKTEILSSWPKSGDILFGGQEVDQLLQGFFRDYLEPEDLAQALRKIGIDQFKSWKERSVSPALAKKDSVTEFYALDNYVDIADMEIGEYTLDRAAFEKCAADYLTQFPKLVNGCLGDAGMQGGDVDLVIVTGGHSQWYFVQEMLSGKMEQFGKIDLPKIRENPARIIPISRPQETVALGLVYGRLTPVVNQPETHGTFAVNNSVRENPSTQKEVICGSIVEARAAMLAKAHGAAIAAGWNHAVGLSGSGTVMATGYNDRGQCNVSNWHDIVAVSAGYYHTVGLRSDGTVVAVGFNKKTERAMGRFGFSRTRSVPCGQCDVSNWHDIIAVAAGFYHTIGLKKDGTVVAAGDNDRGQCNVNSWHDITAVAAKGNCTVGLRRNGTVVATGNNHDGQCNVNSWQGWQNIIAVAAGAAHTVGLRSDGTVVAIGRKGNDQCEVNNWHNIIAVSAGTYHTVGLRSDGTVVATGTNDKGQCNVNSWHDIIAISAADAHTVGLRSDGTVVATGINDDGPWDVQSWKLL